MTVAPVAPSVVVEGAARAPLPFGLFSVVPLRPAGDGRWQSGVVWDALTCEPARGLGAPDCDPDTDQVGAPKDLDVEWDVPAASAFTVYGVWQCTPTGWTVEGAARMAEAHLLAREEARVEQALWTGDLGNVPNLVGEAAVTVTGSNAKVAVGALEARIASAYGSLGVLHAPRDLASFLASEGVIERQGARLVTKLGTPVVAGAGYPSQGRIIGSPPIFGYRSEVFAPSARAGDLLDRGRNDLYAIAERTYLLGFDPCGVTAATIPTGATP